MQAQLAAFERILSHDLSVRQVEQLARKTKSEESREEPRTGGAQVRL